MCTTWWKNRENQDRLLSDPAHLSPFTQHWLFSSIKSHSEQSQFFITEFSVHSQRVYINLTVNSDFFFSLRTSTPESLCCHFFISFILRVVLMAIWITHHHFKILHKVFSCFHLAMLPATEVMREIWKEQIPNQAQCISLFTAYYFLDVSFDWSSVTVELSPK